MKNKNTKTQMIISAAAASRLFLKIASMEMDTVEKCHLMTVVSGVIGGHADIAQANFFGAEDIRLDLAKAIIRSARARAAAARRRHAASERPTESIQETEQAATVTLPAEETSADETAQPVDSIPAEAQASGNGKRKRRNRRRRRNRQRSLDGQG
ncbi:MAG: hypothetical protein K2K55_06565 [Duncaniella sp.]|nr:hypothetical protein [Duncaniella sp.]